MFEYLTEGKWMSYCNNGEKNTCDHRSRMKNLLICSNMWFVVNLLHVCKLNKTLYTNKDQAYTASQSWAADADTGRVSGRGLGKDATNQRATSCNNMHDESAT